MKEADIQLFAIDLDGTLLRPDETVSSYTVATLREVVRVGHRVVLVTARPPRTLAPVASQLGIKGRAICGNGSLVYDLATNTVVKATTIESTVLAQILAALRTRIGDIGLACEMGLTFGHDDGYVSVHAVPGDAVRGPAESWLPRGVTKLMVQSTSLEFEDLVRTVEDVVGGRLVVTYSSDRFVEVLASGVTKAAALSELAAEAGLQPSQVVAFGDMPNDLAMLEWAGTAVAVANAHPAVVAAADVVTTSNADDGVARYLEAVISPLRYRGGGPTSTTRR